MSHHQNKKVLDEDQRNTNIHKMKRRFGQTLSPRAAGIMEGGNLGGSRFSGRDNEYPNDLNFRKNKRFKDDQFGSNIDFQQFGGGNHSSEGGSAHNQDGGQAYPSNNPIAKFQQYEQNPIASKNLGHTNLSAAANRRSSPDQNRNEKANTNRRETDNSYRRDKDYSTRDRNDRDRKSSRSSSRNRKSSYNQSNRYNRSYRTENAGNRRDKKSSRSSSSSGSSSSSYDRKRKDSRKNYDSRYRRGYNDRDYDSSRNNKSSSGRDRSKSKLNLLEASRLADERLSQGFGGHIKQERQGSPRSDRKDDRAEKKPSSYHQTSPTSTIPQVKQEQPAQVQSSTQSVNKNQQQISYNSTRYETQGQSYNQQQNNLNKFTASQPAAQGAYTYQQQAPYQQNQVYQNQSYQGSYVQYPSTDQSFYQQQPYQQYNQTFQSQQVPLQQNTQSYQSYPPYQQQIPQQTYTDQTMIDTTTYHSQQPTQLQSSLPQATPIVQPKASFEPKDVAILYYKTSNKDFDKWRESLTKIFGNHPQINQQLFQQAKEQFKKTKKDDDRSYREQVSKYLDKDDIKKVSNDKYQQYLQQKQKAKEQAADQEVKVEIIGQDVEMKQTLNDESTQEDQKVEPTPFDLKFHQPVQIINPVNKKMQENQRKVEELDRQYRMSKMHLTEMMDKRDAQLRTIQIRDIRLGIMQQNQ
eukprot:403339530